MDLLLELNRRDGVTIVMVTHDEQQALKTERRHELFLEGHRMLDMRRFGEFPAGWQAGCVPVPRAELNNNPNLRG